MNVATAFPYNHTAGRDTTGDRIAGNDRPAGVAYNALRGDKFIRTDLRLSKNIRLEREDTVVVPEIALGGNLQEIQDRRIYVLGKVAKPGVAGEALLRAALAVLR